MKKLLRAMIWVLWLAWPFRRPPRRLPWPWPASSQPRIAPLKNVSDCVTYDEWRRRHPEAPVETVTLESLDPAARGKPRVPLAAARQYALEMLGLRKWTRKQPFAIGGVVVQTARVRVFEATRSETGEELAREVRQLRIVYPDGRDEQIEFFADGQLYFHAKG